MKLNRCLWASALLAGTLVFPRGGWAYESVGEVAQSATSIGGRQAYYRFKDSDRGQWAPGAQLRLHMARAYSLEGSADFGHYSIGGTNVRVIPVQVSLIGYFYPETTISPYLVLGAGWYITHADGPTTGAPRQFGPHVGAGLELLLGSNWSIDGSYRYLWTEVWRLKDPLHPLGRNFSKRGSQLTVGLNYRL